MNTQTDNSNNKIFAIVSYLHIIGAIISLVMNMEKKDPFVSFHIRQGLGLTLLSMAIGTMVSGFDNWLVSGPFYIFFFILWIYGIIGAIQGQMYVIPVIGPFFQKLFKSI